MCFCDISKSIVTILFVIGFCSSVFFFLFSQVLFRSPHSVKFTLIPKDTTRRNHWHQIDLEHISYREKRYKNSSLSQRILFFNSHKHTRAHTNTYTVKAQRPDCIEYELKLRQTQTHFIFSGTIALIYISYSLKILHFRLSFIEFESILLNVLYIEMKCDLRQYSIKQKLRKIAEKLTLFEAYFSFE